MTSIETYRESIASLKARIEALKSGDKVSIARTDGTEYEVERPGTLTSHGGR